MYIYTQKIIFEAYWLLGALPYVLGLYHCVHFVHFVYHFETIKCET